MSDQKNNHYLRDFIYTCPSKVFNDPSISLNELKIYMMIRSFLDTTGLAYPSNNWIADTLGINRRNTINNINKLVTKGYIERFEHEGKRYLRIKTASVVEEGVSQKTLPSVAKDTPPSVAKDTQLYQSNIRSKIIIEKKKKPPRYSTTVSLDFIPNESHELLASTMQLDLNRETKSFIDYYEAHGKKMVNWDAAFRNWLRKSFEFKNKAQNKEHPVTATIREIKNIYNSKAFMQLTS